MRTKAALALLLLLTTSALGHMPDRPDLNKWFSQLGSKGGGLCCSFADGMKVEDVDWDNSGENNGYRVRLADRWIKDTEYMHNLPGSMEHWKPEPGTPYSWKPVPDDVVVKEPNRYGPAIVWPIIYAGRIVNIRCFLPGAGT